MKKTMLAVFAAGLFIAVPSCKKGENDPALSLKSRKGRLSQEWTVASFVETSTYTSTYVDNPSTDGDLLTSTSTDNMTFENGMISSTSTNASTYDGDGPNGQTASSSSSTSSGATITTSNSNTDGSGTVSWDNSGVYTSSGNWTITFVKDGTFSMSKTMMTKTTYTDDDDARTHVDTDESTNTTTVNGTWSFISKNKADEFKNKERIALWYSDDSYVTNDISSDVYTDKDADDFIDYTTYNSNGTSNNTNSYVSTSSNPDEIWELDMLKGKEVTAMRTYSSTSTGTSSTSTTSGGTTVTTTGNPSNNTSEGTTTMTLTRD